MGRYTVYAPHSTKYGGAIFVSIHVDALYLHGPGRSIRCVFLAILTTCVTSLTVAVVLVLHAVKNPVVFMRLDITKRGYAWTYVIG